MLPFSSVSFNSTGIGGMGWEVDWEYYNSDMTVDGGDSLVATRNQEFGGYELFTGEDYAVFTA